MLKFLLGMYVGRRLSRTYKPYTPKPQKPAITSAQLYEHDQVKVLINIVKTAAKIEATNPSPESLRDQLRPLKIMFDEIDYDGLISSDAKTVYHQLEEEFEANGLD